MLDNLHRTAGLVVSERLASELTAVLGRGPARRLLNRATARSASEGLSLEQVLAAAPELEGLVDRDQLHRLSDPAGYLGASVALVDRALERMPRPPRREGA
jgi:3-carboxy-cis,cis-muconate cycloisomerase